MPTAYIGIAYLSTLYMYNVDKYFKHTSSICVCACVCSRNSMDFNTSREYHIGRG